MIQTPTERALMQLVGITCRTSNSTLFEVDPTTNNVAKTIMEYFHNKLHDKIQHRKTPGTTYCIYTQYESDHNGEYTYFIGEEVTSLQDIDKELETLSIPAQRYIKFTCGPGPMPDLCIEAWQAIWALSADELGGERAYIADFEVYDERSQDHSNLTLDIYIGIKG